MRVLIGLAHIPFVKRSVDSLAETLRQALISAGHIADIAKIPLQWTPPERVFNTLLACRFMDWTDLTDTDHEILLALEFPAYLVQHPYKVLWLTHHRDFCGFLQEGPEAAGAVPANTALDALQEADRRYLPELKKVFSISATASCQLRRAIRLSALPLYPPPRVIERPPYNEADDHYLVPPAIRPRARFQLLLEAVALSRESTRLRICARPDALGPDRKIRRLAAQLKNRIEWLGPVTDQELSRLYAECRAVVYPTHEDTFPWSSFWAMLASRPIITCDDSGGPAEVVDHQETGLTVAADPAELASAMDEFSRHPNVAYAMGASGRRRLESLNLNWPRTIETLLS